MKLCLVRVFCSVIHKILVLIVKKTCLSLYRVELPRELQSGDGLRNKDRDSVQGILVV